MKPISRDTVLAALRRHIGQANGITAPDLVREITEDLLCEAAGERLLRSCVSELRAEGVAICAHPAHGYFIAQTSEEVELCCRFLRSRAMHSLVLESRLRRISLPDLIGQLKLPT
jgi:hypothetical protein